MLTNEPTNSDGLDKGRIQREPAENHPKAWIEVTNLLDISYDSPSFAEFFEKKF